METILTPGGRQPASAASIAAASDATVRHTTRPLRSSYRRQLDPFAHRREQQAQQAAPLATALGWFSIGMGVAHLIAPRALGATIGVEGRPLLLRAIGAREVMSGVGILGRSGRPGWLWSRVAGDAMDLALLGMAAKTATRTQRQRIAMATTFVAAMASLDVITSVRQARAANANAAFLTLEKSITVNRPPEEVYQFWRAIENFPRFMRHLESVTLIGGNRSHWRARGPFGRSVEWDAEITIDEPGKMLAWRSLDEADVRHAGSVRFESAASGRATIVHVDFDYRPPAGKFGAFIARLFGEEPQTQVDADLRRFKQLLETGEIPTIEGQSSGRRSMLVRLIRRGASR